MPSLAGPVSEIVDVAVFVMLSEALSLLLRVNPKLALTSPPLPKMPPPAVAVIE
jgi:hypothetical protein